MKQVKSILFVFTWLLVPVLLLAACIPTAGMGSTVTPAVDDAAQLSEDVQFYIDLSRADLAEQLGISSDEIELESVTASESAIDPVIVKLAANGRIFEYHGRDEEVLQISSSSASGQLMFAPAVVDSVEVQIDESAPAPVSVLVRGNLPDNCTEIGEGMAVLQDDQTFAVSVTTQRPDGEACGEVLVPYETAVSLGVEVQNLPAGDYTIIVNDQVTETFTWQPGEDNADASTEFGLPQVAITLDEGVAASVTMYNRPAVRDNENMPEWVLQPAHVEVEVGGYAHTSSMQMPRIYVYPTAAFSEISEMTAQQISTLEELLIKQPNLNELSTLPFLPFLNASSLLHVQGQYVTFANGSGIRYLTQLGQAIGPVNNAELLYTFQGLTDDGAYYVAAIFPVAQADLPANMASADDTFPNGFETYIEEVKAALSAAGADSFTPNIDRLDTMLASLEISD